MLVVVLWLDEKSCAKLPVVIASRYRLTLIMSLVTLSFDLVDAS